MDKGAELFRQFLDGDEKAFEQIVDLYFDSLIFFVDSFVHDKYTAEDIAIESLAQLYLKRRQYNFNYSLKTYLFTIGKNKALNFLKHQHRYEIVDFSEALSSQNKYDILYEDIAISERNRIIAAAINQLSPEMQKVIYLFYFENLKHDEIAVIMNKRKKQIYNIMFEAKKKLKLLIGEEGEDLL
ncbi:MAG: RNA polymerase sigma factor [Clostridiales bacterium]|nr:RNA polymerase sigma factor [Clostridiales bacterium]